MKIARAGLSAVLLAAVLFCQVSAARNSCESLASLALPNTKITLAQFLAAGAFTLPVAPGQNNSGLPAPFSCWNAKVPTVRHV
jgi:hypothetical protein